MVCYYNARDRLPETLDYLARLDRIPGTPTEVIFVDNASTDGSTDFIRQSWSGPAVPVFIAESRPGVSWARRTGLQACRYDCIGIVDDDNWVAPDWAAQGRQYLDAHPEAGGVGGLNQAVFEVPAPSWYERYQGSYAVGPQTGVKDNTNQFGLIWGAGSFLRKAAVDQALALGIDPLIPSRQGRSLLSGDESEIMLQMQLFGWRFFYEPSIQISHFMPKERLSWAYYLRLREGTGRTSVYLDMYRRLADHYLLGHPLMAYDWKKEQRLAKSRLKRDVPGLVATLLPGFEGNYRAALAQSNLGIFRERKAQGASLAKAFNALREKVAAQFGP